MQIDNINNIFGYYKKIFMYKLTLYKKIFDHTYDPNNFPWWNEIGDKIILGAIPLKNYKHDTILKDKEHVKYIITILDKFEIDTITYISEPVTEEIWKYNDIEQKIVNAPDFMPIELNELHELVLYIKKCIDIIGDGNDKIYIHCKSGHGRSALVVMAFLMSKYGMTPDNAYTYVKNKRSVVNINSGQYESLVNYRNKYLMYYIDIANQI